MENVYFTGSRHNNPQDCFEKVGSYLQGAGGKAKLVQIVEDPSNPEALTFESTSDTSPRKPHSNPSFLAKIGALFSSFSTSYTQKSKAFQVYKAKKAQAKEVLRRKEITKQKEIQRLQKIERLEELAIKKEIELDATSLEIFQRPVEELRAIVADKWSYPRAIGGNTPVQLYKDKHGSLVIKIIPNKATVLMRLQKKSEALKLLDGGKRVIVPQAVYLEKEEVLVETMFKGSGSVYANISTYIENPKAFDKAICEMVDLFSKGYLADLGRAYYQYPLRHLGISETNTPSIPRYDNLLLTIRQTESGSVGEIGLIDLEHFSTGHNKESLKTLISMFPRHTDLIIQRAKQLKEADPSLWGKIDEAELHAHADRYNHSLDLAYTDYIKWLKETEKTATTLQISPSLEVKQKLALRIDEAFAHFEISIPEKEKDSLCHDLADILLSYINVEAEKKEALLASLPKEKKWKLLEERKVTCDTNHMMDDKARSFRAFCTRSKEAGVDFYDSKITKKWTDPPTLVTYMLALILEDLEKENLIYSFTPKANIINTATALNIRM